MAAIDLPWLSHPLHSMSRDETALGGTPPSYDSSGAPPTYAAFSPVTLQANTPSRSARRSTILVHKKSPLLLATPPQVTRALAYSHPFLLPLNKLAGLLTWTSGDSWQSFLLLCAFWAVVLYGDVVVTWAGPVATAVGLIAAMYGRRYSPLSSSGWAEPRDTKDAASKHDTSGSSQKSGGKPGGAGPTEKASKHQRAASEVTNTKHQKTLDEIVETLKELTGRCNVLMDPLLAMTDFLSTQQTATSATTKPALIAMFVRLLIITPFWVALALPPWRIITTRRVVLLAGSLILTWHARPMRVSRAILWRSATIRRFAAAVTGLHFDSPVFSSHGDRHGTDWRSQDPTIQRQDSDTKATSAYHQARRMALDHRRAGSQKSSGVKFTFIIYENQRRWVGLGWTNSLFTYERPAWTDEHMNAAPARDEFDLPDVEDGSNMQWRWAPGSRWRVDGVADENGAVDYDGDVAKNGWIFYDNKWQNGRRGQDGWGRWTRRRKWYRDAELVEVDDSPTDQETPTKEKSASTQPITQSYTTSDEKMVPTTRSEAIPTSTTPAVADDAASVHSTSSASRSSFFLPSSMLRKRMPSSSAVPAPVASESTDAKDRADNAAADQKNYRKKDSTTTWNQGQRQRRSSESVKSVDVDDDDDGQSGLGIEVEMELQKQGKGADWGIGDEARMSLG